MQYIIATLASHSALQILKGAHDEGFKTLAITTPQTTAFYKQFKFIHDIIELPSFKEFPSIETVLKKRNVILIPHGSFVSYVGVKEYKKMKVLSYGNKKVLDWEADRMKQRSWLTKAGVTQPEIFIDPEEIDRPVIVKLHGAAGGRGYFYATNQAEFKRKIHVFDDNAEYIIQEYIVGVPVYIHYFYSPVTNAIQILSVDRRYETNVDGLGRIPPQDQMSLQIEPSYVVIGNSPLVLRESLLPLAHEMGQGIVDASKKMIDKRGMYGPFCLETIVTQDQKFYVIEISCRIVAGTNLFIEGSPYSALYYDEPMSTGRRIAREIKEAVEKKKIELILE